MKMFQIILNRIKKKRKKRIIDRKIFLDANFIFNCRTFHLFQRFLLLLFFFFWIIICVNHIAVYSGTFSIKTAFTNILVWVELPFIFVCLFFFFSIIISISYCLHIAVSPPPPHPALFMLLKCLKMHSHFSEWRLNNLNENYAFSIKLK